MSDSSDQEAFFKGIQLFQIFDLSIALNLFIVSKEPVINKALFHFISQKWLDNILEIFLVFEVDKQVYFVAAEIGVFLVLFFSLKSIPLDQKF